MDTDTHNLPPQFNFMEKFINGGSEHISLHPTEDRITKTVKYTAHGFLKGSNDRLPGDDADDDASDPNSYYYPYERGTGVKVTITVCEGVVLKLRLVIGDDATQRYLITAGASDIVRFTGILNYMRDDVVFIPYTPVNLRMAQLNG